MRLTPEVVLRSPQRLNCCGQRELVLRGLAAPFVESLGVMRDGFDLLDLSQNALASLGTGFPPSPRLSGLYAGSNAIRALESGFADSLPNLRTLVLTANAIETVSDLNLDELSKLMQLETLAINENPVASTPGIRSLLLHRIPSLRFIDFVRVTRAERMATEKEHGPPSSEHLSTTRKPAKIRRAKPTFNSEPMDTVPEHERHEPGHERQGDTGRPVQARLSAEQVDQIKAAISAANSLDEIAALQQALRSGDLSAIPGIG
jgi:U2 small nuclear ribonucleoprotein A'